MIKRPRMSVINDCSECHYSLGNFCSLLGRTIEDRENECPLPHLCGFDMLFVELEVIKEDRTLLKLELPVHYFLKMAEQVCESSREELFESILEHPEVDLLLPDQVRWFVRRK